jgi:hypothetical protein
MPFPWCAGLHYLAVQEARNLRLGIPFKSQIELQTGQLWLVCLCSERNAEGVRKNPVQWRNFCLDLFVSC